MGEKLKEVGQVFWNPLWKLLLSPLKMAHVFISCYSWVICLSTNYMCHHNFLFHSKISLIFCHIMFLVLVESMLPSQFSCIMTFKGSFSSNLPSAVLPVSISYVSPYSFDPPSQITFSCQFRVDDGGYIKALLRRVYSHRICHII
jgi:hypothetical protein